MNNLSLSVTMPEGTTREEAVQLADEVMERVMSVDNVSDAGFMMGSGTMGGLSLTSTSNGSYDVTGYITMPEGTFGSEAGKEIEALCADLPCKVTASGVMSGMMSYMTGSGVSLTVYGSDMEELQSAARALGQRVAQAEGVTEVSDGLEDAAPALQVVVDRNKAMTKGITVAQIYMQVAAALSDTTTVSTVTLDGDSMEMIVDAAEGSKLTREKLLDLTITPDDSMSASLGGASASASASGLSQLTGEDGEDEDTSFRLGDVAEIRETVSLNSISRDQQRRCITVTAAIAEGYNVTKVTSEVQRLVSGLTLPDTVTVEFNGENEQIMDAMTQLMLMLLLGVVLVYLIMVAQFQSLKSPVHRHVHHPPGLYRRLPGPAHRGHRGVGGQPHRLRHAGGHYRQQRHRAGGLYQPAAAGGHGAAGGHHRRGRYPPAAYPDDQPDYHPGPDRHGGGQKCRHGPDPAHRPGLHRRIAVRHADDAVRRAVYVRPAE